MIIRKATLEDLDFFLETYNDESFLEQNESNDPISEDIAAMLIVHPFCNWNIIEDEKPLRIGIFTTFVRTDGIYWGIGINNKFRRKGYATRCIKTFLSYYDGRKTDSYLEVYEDNFAKKLYEKLGYKDTKDFKIIRNRKFRKMFRKHK